MPFAFPQALNPLSEFSGVHFLNHEEQIRDRMVSATIAHLFQQSHNLSCILFHIHEIIIGSHYFLLPRNRGLGSKGLLDFLIFPLLARKLLFDVMCNEGSSIYLNLFALPVGSCLELVRITMGIILLNLLAPLIFCIYIVYSMLFNSGNKPKLAQSTPLTKSSANEEKVAHLNIEHPSDFICPISFQLMTHPVRVKTHYQHCFERDWIKYHFQTNGFFNPLNRQPLTTTDLEYAHDLKKKIDSYVQNILAAKNTPH